MQNAQTLVMQYLEAFNETDADRRSGGVERLEQLSPYTDPHVDGFIEQTQDRFPGFTFTRGGPIDVHHNQARFQWHAGREDKPDTYVGFDVILTEVGRIRNVTASWTPPPLPERSAASTARAWRGAAEVGARQSTHTPDAQGLNGEPDESPGGFS